MLTGIQRWWRRRSLRHYLVAAPSWSRCVAETPALARLSASERVRLRELTSLFLQEKTFVAAGGMTLDEDMRLSIAAQACLLILNLDLTWYEGWHEIVVYPDSFWVEHEEQDEAGVVHRVRRALDGESWERGPVVLAWEDARPGALPHGPGSNVVIHEFAHKLDMAGGAANGMPPLHAGMDRQAWTTAFSRAYADLERAVEEQQPTQIDPYAAESPAECFAVFSEAFFEAPWTLASCYPDVYRQLALFYRQQPPTTGPS